MAFQPTPATPQEIAQLIRRMKGEENRHTPPVTFLIGSGFSRSAGILTGSEIVEKKLRPILPNVPSAPPNRSEYAHLMSLLQPRERARIIKECIDAAKDKDTGALTINWAHLLLTSMVASGYVHLILTTNFDPLIIDALAITGLPIRAYDLTAGGAYLAGTLDSGSAIYLHGQSHAPFLANVDAETERVRQHLPVVFADAMRESTLIVIGYSGDCDPVLQELCKHYPQFPYGCYWVHRDAAKPLGEQASVLLEDGLRQSRLVTGFDADRFMDELVIGGLGLELPRMILNPLGSLDHSLRRIAPLPPREGAPPEISPVAAAREHVQQAAALVEQVARKPPPAKSSVKKTSKGSKKTQTPFKAHKDTTSSKAPLKMRVSMAALLGDAIELENLRPLVLKAKDKSLQYELGNGFMKAAGQALLKGILYTGIQLLCRAEEFGTTEPHWLAATWATAFDFEARKKKGNEADALYRKAYARYREAVKIKPEFSEAWSNWGSTLNHQAQQKSGSRADALWRESSAKHAEAARLNPNKSDIWMNWGNALGNRAEHKVGSDAMVLWKRAHASYAKAARLNPEDFNVWYNWGVTYNRQAQSKRGKQKLKLLAAAEEKYATAISKPFAKDSAFFNYACLAALRGDAGTTIARLREWLPHFQGDPAAKIAKDEDFEPVREKPEFQAFLTELKKHTPPPDNVA